MQGGEMVETDVTPDVRTQPRLLETLQKIVSTAAHIPGTLCSLFAGRCTEVRHGYAQGIQAAQCSRVTGSRPPGLILLSVTERALPGDPIDLRSVI